MWEKLRVVFTIPELQRKIGVTLMFLLIYRLGWQVPLPIINQEAIRAWSEQSQNGDFAQIWQNVAMFSGSSLSQATIFGLGIMPYISASIIFQLLASVWKPLEDLKKEGESGQKKINKYTRWATVFLCLFQSGVYLNYLSSQGGGELIRSEAMSGLHLTWSWWIVSILTMTAGTVFLMWVGEQIDEHGVGNGISLLIMAGILAQMPAAGIELFNTSSRRLGDPMALGPDKLLLLGFMFVGVVAGVVLITQGQRRIPMHSARHMRGRKVLGGGRTYLPLRVNQAGVMPIIFASSLLMLPSFAIQGLMQIPYLQSNSALMTAKQALQPGSGFTYNLIYVLGIYLFCYFWTAITFNPKEIADNLKKNGSFIPGYRPGKRTADYLEKVMARITYVGAGFLALVAVIPTVMAGVWNIPPVVASFYGGTGLLIAVSV
ncbi:MAG TPA: preprotein translocase subunit SecY, partial [Pirellulales bacterium]